MIKIELTTEAQAYITATGVKDLSIYTERQESC